ncbi:MAG: response regulator transcription factor [Actinomycetota bacterium]|nr:response regulator transcription factor [Actinomycetota bacterium]
MELIGGLVVDDHTYMRSAMRNALAELGVSPVREAVSLAEGRSLIAEFHPFVAVMDLSLDDGSSLGLIATLKEAGTRVMALTSSDDAYTVRAAHAAGVLGYLLKSAPHEAVMHGLREVIEGRSYADPSVARLLPDAAPPPAPTADEVDLTLREMSLLQYVAEGLGNAEVAERLGMDALTVKANLATIGRKLGVSDRMDMVATARRLELLP